VKKYRVSSCYSRCYT